MNARGKAVDTTYLSLDTAEERGFIHRDYIAHCLRWSHTIKMLMQGKLYERATIIDVGCGKEAPLAKLLYSSRMSPHQYIGIDYGKIPDTTLQIFHTGKFPGTFWDETDFAVWSQGPDLHAIADVVTCFEMLEHVEPAHVIATLRGIARILKPNGFALLSTPCWDVVSCAANHVNEMRYEVLGAVIEASGFAIRNVYGTFASIRDIEPHLAPPHREVFNDLRDYYDVNYLATVLAPFYPSHSRNCLWHIAHAERDYLGIFDLLQACPKPWTSSARWEDLMQVYDPFVYGRE